VGCVPSKAVAGGTVNTAEGGSKLMQYSFDNNWGSLLAILNTYILKVVRNMEC